MTRSARYSLLLMIVSTLAAAVYYFGRPRMEPPPALELTPSADAPARLLALTLPDTEGKPQPLSQWRGKVLVVNFWATWCPPCKEEMPEFSRISNEYAGKSVQFVGISIDSAEKVASFGKETPVSYPLLIGNLETLDLSVALGNAAKALPFTVVLRRDGTPQRVKLGKFSAPELEKTLQAALRGD